MLPSHISSAAIFIPVVPHLHQRARPPLSSQLNLSNITIILHIRRTSIVILPLLCCGPYHIIFHNSVYFATVVCLPSPIGSSTLSTLLYTTLLATLCPTLLFSLSFLISSLLLTFIFWHGSSLSPWFYRSAPICPIFSTFLYSALLQSDHPPQIFLLWSAWSVTDMLNYDCSDHALICLFWYNLIIFLRSALSFVPLDLLISLTKTYSYVTHHILLACTIT